MIDSHTRKEGQEGGNGGSGGGVVVVTRIQWYVREVQAGKAGYVGKKVHA